jgi:hypothetical protein
MKRLPLTLSAAALALCAFAANAQPNGTDPYSMEYNPLITFHSEKTRAQVQEELAQFQKSGVNPWAIAYNPLDSFHSEKTREQVRGEYLANREAYDAMHTEDGGSAYLAAHRQGNPGSRLAGKPGASAY